MYNVIRRITSRGARREFLVAKFKQHEHALKFVLSKQAGKAGNSLYIHYEFTGAVPAAVKHGDI